MIADIIHEFLIENGFTCSRIIRKTDGARWWIGSEYSRIYFAMQDKGGHTRIQLWADEQKSNEWTPMKTIGVTMFFVSIDIDNPHCFDMIVQRLQEAGCD